MKPRHSRAWSPLPHFVIFLLVLGSASSTLSGQSLTLPNPVMFVTQVPIPQDFATIGSVFANHRASLGSVGRGGDLWMRYPDGSLKNLTAGAGYGSSGFQGSNAIAVRDPCVHWDGTKAVFSMVVGAPTAQYQTGTWYWQLYEISGLGAAEIPQITRVPYQPPDANNISPIYGSDDRIIFTSDRPPTGETHLARPLDEYESTPVVTGLWSLDPVIGHLRNFAHSPSGDFTPFLDSFGRVLFSRWDHLQRDQQADAEALGYATYGIFNWSDEGSTSLPTASVTEHFPEPRPARTDLLAGTNLRGHRFNHFFPWQVHQDGTGFETLNHIGRHELHDYFDRDINGDPNVIEFIASSSNRVNPNGIENFLQIAESALVSGTYYGVDAPEFQTHAAGQIIAIALPPSANPDQAQIQYVTHRDTRSVTSNPSPNHSGFYREPLPLANGALLAVHTPDTDRDINLGTTAQPASRYDFRIKAVVPQGNHHVAGTALTPGINKAISYWNPDVLVTYNGELWELNPVEVRVRARPPTTTQDLEAPEQQAFAQAGVDVNTFKAWLHQNDVALIVSRDVTSRDANDRQQPFNLRVPGSATQTVGAPGAIYDVSHLQIFQGDLLRGMGGIQSPNQGRRVLAWPLHATSALNPPNPLGPEGSVPIAADGSTAALVPARRALTWQLTDGTGTGMVRERYWLGFQAGEIRACASCHGLNTADQAGQGVPTNPPQALVQLLQHWQAQTSAPPSLGSAGSGNVGLPSAGPFNVLLINGTSGGTERRVDLGLGQPFTLSLIDPPTHPGGAPFVLYGLVGAPAPTLMFPTSLGTFAFPPAHVSPIPGAIVLANGIFQDPWAILPATLTPWHVPVPGLNVPLTLTLQGIVQDRLDPSDPWGITNGIILRVQ